MVPESRKSDHLQKISAFDDNKQTTAAVKLNVLTCIFMYSTIV